MTTDGIGLYIHIPFCVSKCKYCDFASFGGLSESVRGKYISALISELEGYKREPKILIDTVFFGGGTPSLLSEGNMEKILSKARECFDISENAEITVEVNPKTAEYDKLSAFRTLGVNRLSIGLQSIHENELKKLGRIHTFDDFLSTFKTAREVGFNNISVDIMYGIPEQTVDSFKETLDTLIALNPEHISSYGLIIEEGTPFFESRDTLPLPDEDTEELMYRMAVERLASAGYSHYEISNYAKDGFTCRHNLKYWRDEEYIGVGLAAYSYFEGVRFGNTRNFSEYISAPTNARADTEHLTAEDEAYEYAMMRLRLSEGISLSDYRERFSVDFLTSRREGIEKYVGAGLLSLNGDRVSLTDAGFYLSNTIMSELL